VFESFFIYLLFLVPPFLFMIYAQYKVISTYNKYSKVANMQRMNGAQAAQVLLRANDLTNVRIEGVKGKLTDHYDPRNKVLRLSEEVYTKPSVASLGIVAHEVGHAVQDNRGYAPMRVRAALVPAASIGSSLGYYLALIGLLLYVLAESLKDTAEWLVLIGIVLFAAAVLFTLVTLPVEYNASSRARQMLKANGLVSTQEYNAASAVLSAAALTYVAALLQAVAQLLFFVMMLFGMRR
jgi:Zn-dependent membrane protease YugP